MKEWFTRGPRHMGDWLLLVAAGALVWRLFDVLPALAGFGQTLLGILSPFALGLVLAYILDIPARFLAKKVFRGKRLPAILCSYLLLFGFLAALVGLVVPQLMESISRFLGRLDDYSDTLSGILASIQESSGLTTGNVQDLLDSLGADLESIFTNMLGGAGQLAGAAMNAASGAMDVFISLAVSVYLLTGKESLLRGARLTIRAALPPRAAGNVFSVCTMANKTFSGYIGGQLVDALLVGVETFVLMTLFRLPYAPLLGVLVGVTNIIPVLGPFIGCVPGALLLLLESPLQAIEFVLIILVVQQVDGNFIAPRILGGATGLSGLGVLFAILVGGDLFGIAGMLVAVPTLAVFVTLARQAVGAGLSARGIDPETGGEAAPEEQ